MWEYVELNIGSDQDYILIESYTLCSSAKISSNELLHILKVIELQRYIPHSLASTMKYIEIIIELIKVDCESYYTLSI